MSLTKTEKKGVSHYAEAKRKAAQEVARERIQTDRLIDLAQKYALGEKVVCGKDENGNYKYAEIEMSPTRLKTIEMLLGKSMPDLASVKHEVEAKSVTFVIEDFKADE